MELQPDGGAAKQVMSVVEGERKEGMVRWCGWGVVIIGAVCVCVCVFPQTGTPDAVW